jgi:hypothetical protein
MGLRAFTVHTRAWSAEADGDALLIKEGFSWPALVFGPFWALWHGMWKTAIVLFAAAIAITLAATLGGFSGGAESAVSLAVQAATGLWANDWRRHVLARKGYVETTAVLARNLRDAEERFLFSAPGAWGRA